VVALDAGMAEVPGAGPVTAQRLGKAGIVCVRDLLSFFPRAYEDYRRTYALAELTELAHGTPIVVRGTVVRVHRFFRRMLDVVLEDGAHRLRARWFRPNAGMVKSYPKGAIVALAGRLRRAEDGALELIHPSNVTATLAEGGSVGIRPRYPSIDKVPGRGLEKLVRVALLRALFDGEDALPSELRSRLGLPDLAQALRSVHAPASDLGQEDFLALQEGRAPALRRFAFEDLFVLQVALAMERKRMQGLGAPACSAEPSETMALLGSALPFSLTAGQARAIQRILTAFSEGSVQCLLQGDVGSGKTAVAFAACVHVARAGGQSLVMAPTAVLAEQHVRSLGAWGARIGVRVGLLHAGLSSSDQRALLAAAAAGQVEVIVGTQALLEARVQLPRLSLAIVDEQHRFGVEQRARLRRMHRGGTSQGGNGWKIDGQSGMVPHLLVLSATPIPRTLALTLYGDLDLVTLDGLPPGRLPVLTQVCRGPAQREQAYARLKHLVGEGGQAFVVCPAIAPASDGPDDHDGTQDRATSVLALARSLRPLLAPARIGLVHGKLGSDQQHKVLHAFRDRALDVLVATTVLEVGVDVPSATCMVIEDADRFGLAQLHQLRGRVGRGRAQGHCFLLTRASNDEAIERLRILADVHDGFHIAEEDLRLRGAGDVQGTRQTGTPDLRFAHLPAYAELMEHARDEAGRVLGHDPDLVAPEHTGLRAAVARRLSQSRPVAEEAG
jgi:ATP-dependent DNA helicase RecG